MWSTSVGYASDYVFDNLSPIDATDASKCCEEIWRRLELTSIHGITVSFDVGQHVIVVPPSPYKASLNPQQPPPLDQPGSLTNLNQIRPTRCVVHRGPIRWQKRQWFVCEPASRGMPQKCKHSMWQQ